MDSGFTKAQDGRAGGFWCICTEWGGSMRKLRRAALMALLVVGFVGTGANPASAGTTRVSGTAAFDRGARVRNRLPRSMTTRRSTYQAASKAAGTPTCCGRRTSATQGSTSRWGKSCSSAPSTGSRARSRRSTCSRQSSAADGLEVSGQCQHPIVRGSGTGELQGIGGLILFTDIVTPTEITYVYRGVVSL